MTEYGPYTIRCWLFGCSWSRWVGKNVDYVDVAGKKCARCGRWKYDDGSYMPPVHHG